MNSTDFRANSPGRLVTIPKHGGLAFVPHALPPEWEIPTRTWPVIAEVKQLLGRLEGLGKALPNPRILLTPLRNREAIDSSTIEGTYSTPRELVLFQMEDHDDGSMLPTREVANYSAAIRTAVEEGLPLCWDTVLRLHSILLTGSVRADEVIPGETRNRQVVISRKNPFVPAPLEMLGELVDRFEQTLTGPVMLDPLIDAFLMHYQFGVIHPFADGNGRVGRALMALTIYHRCGFSKPWLYLSGYVEAHRAQYFDRLKAVSTHGDWNSWVEFCLKATKAQALDTIERCERIIDLHTDHQARLAVAGGSFRMQQILSQVFESQFVQIAGLARTLEVDYKTAKSDIEKLIKADILAPLADTRPKTFYAPELFALTYEDL